MALNGATNPKRYGAGVYTGSGVNAGGQQGRMAISANGIGGAKPGGATPGASQPKPVARPVATSQATALHTSYPGKAVTTTFGATEPYRSVIRNGKRVLVRLSQLTPAERAGKPPVAGTKPTTGAPTLATGKPLDPLYNIHDSDYYNSYANEQYDLESQLNPIQSELAKLRSNVGGKTLYDTMYERANQGFLQSVASSRDDASKSGLLRSGAYDRTAADLGQSWVAQQDELSNTVGSGRINMLEQNIQQQRSAFAQRQQLLEQAAAARARERLAAASENIYGQTILPNSGS